MKKYTYPNIKKRTQVQSTVDPKNVEAEIEKLDFYSHHLLTAKKKKNTGKYISSWKQLIFLNKIHLNIVSPTMVRLWTTRKGGHYFFEPSSEYNLNDRRLLSIFQPHLTGTKHPEIGYIQSGVVGKMYTNPKALWHPKNQGILSRKDWKWFNTELNRLLWHTERHHVLNAQTVDYKTLEPYPNGLFCNKTFSAPSPVGLSYQRRMQMGFIKLAAPFAHIWYLKARPNYLKILLNMKPKVIKFLAYYKARGAFQTENPQMKYFTKPMRTLFPNRNRNRHYCHEKTFWLNHTISFNALKNSLFDAFIPNWGLTTFFGLEKPQKNHSKNWLLIPSSAAIEAEKYAVKTNFGLTSKKRAWNEQSTEDTLGGLLSQDSSFWSKSWVGFLNSHLTGGPNRKRLKNPWQHKVLFDTNQTLNKSLAIFQTKPDMDSKRKLGCFLIFGIVFNTFQAFVKVDTNKSAAIVKSCRTFDPFSQTQVYSHYSPALKAFFNHVWLVGKKKYPYDLEYRRTLFLPGYKSRWAPQNKFPPISYKKQMAFSTFKQGLNDNYKRCHTQQLENDHHYFQYMRLLISSQLIHWNEKPKQIHQLLLPSSNLGKVRMPCGFRWLAAAKAEFKSLNQWLFTSELKTEPIPGEIFPVSLFTRLLEISPDAQIKKLVLLPFFTRYSPHVKKYSIHQRWFQLFSSVRLSAAFHTQEQKKPNPLGTQKFRSFLREFFQLSCKKNSLLWLIKKSKSILLSSDIAFSEFTIQKSRGSEFLNQHAYEKQKCVSHFLNQLLLAKPYLTSKKSKGRNRVVAFVKKQNLMLRAMDKSIFKASEQCLLNLVEHPFCYCFAKASYQGPALPLLNPFSIQNKYFLVRYLKTSPSARYQNYYNLILRYFRFNAKSSIKKAKKHFQKTRKNWKQLGWKRLAEKQKASGFVDYTDSFEPPATFADQLFDLDMRIEWLRSYFSHRKDLRRNTLGIVPTRFVFRQSFRIIEEEWLRVELFITCETINKKDLCLPSYIDRILFFGNVLNRDLEQNRPMYNTGGDVLRQLLRRYSQNAQVLTSSLPEIQATKRRRALQEPCIFSYDHHPFFHERNVPSDPVRVGDPVYYKTQSESSGSYITWMVNEINDANRIIYGFEQKLTWEPIKPGLPANLNMSRWEIPVEQRFKENYLNWPAPCLTSPFFSTVFGRSSKYFYHRKMYVALVQLRKHRFRLIRKLKTCAPFLRKPLICPEWMMIQNLPVLPPDLRPILVVGSQVIISDLTKLYQQIIYRNDRCLARYKRSTSYSYHKMEYYDFYAGRLLQEAIDALMENGKGDGKPVLSTSTDQPLKSLSDMLKGKKGRFRQNLLGKRTDYSGRSVIVVGPKLEISECGLPKQMALELFKPFVIRELIRAGFARHVFSAKKLVKKQPAFVWSILRKIMSDRPVLLNRAPTLHRLGLQAFRPKLVSGRAILLHPLVCSAYNADFDGDQMAVHIPLTEQACGEAWKLMWSRNNILSPATGEATLLPSQDMILGCYYLTSIDVMHRTHQLKQIKKDVSKTLINGPFQSIDQLLKLVQMQVLDYHSVVWLRWPSGFEFEQKQQRCIEIQIDTSGHVIKIYNDFKVYDNFQLSNPIYFIKTTPGRALMNQSIWNSLKP